MERNETRINDKFRSLIDGKDYIVTGINGGSICLKETADENAVEKEVPEKGLFRFFVFTGNDTPYPSPKEGEYTVESGKLFRNGEKVETGTLFISNIVGTTESGVYLAVRSKDDKEKVDLFLYRPGPKADAFIRIMVGKDDYVVFYNDNRVIGVAARDTQLIDLPTKEGEEPEKANAATEVVRFLHGATALYEDDFAMTGYVHKTCAAFEARHEDDEEAVQDVVFIANRQMKKVEGADGLTYHVWPAKKTEQALITRYRVTFHKEDDSCMVTADRRFTVEGDVQEVLPVHDDERNVIVVTDKQFVFSNFGHTHRWASGQEALDIVEKYPHLLKVEFSRDNRVTTFTLGNEGYEAVTVRVEKTRDRGFVNTITEA